MEFSDITRTHTGWDLPVSQLVYLYRHNRDCLICCLWHIPGAQKRKYAQDKIREVVKHLWVLPQIGEVPWAIGHLLCPMRQQWPREGS